jgi:signal transduction histidine kinase
MGQAAEWESSSASGDALVRHLAAVVSDGLAWVEKRRIEWVNERLAEMSGVRPPSGLLGMDLTDAFVDTGSGRPDPAAPRAVECALRRPDGQMRTVSCRPARLDPASAAEVWLIRDVTHVRQVEQELLRSSQDLHAANRELAVLRERLRSEQAEREELLTVVSHELRTPVTVIGGYNRLLLTEEVGPLTEEQRGFLEESTKSCERLNTFIGNLLEASRVAKDGEVLEVCHASLAGAIDSVVELLRPLFEERDLCWHVDVAHDARRARFDPLRVEQILTNLVGNAIKYASRGGTIEIETRLRPSSAPSERSFVEVRVSDDGPGVAATDRERIFEPYVRVGDETRAGGLGLGLAICRRLVEAHGGAIAIFDRPKGGACFSFTLPADGEGAPPGAASEV